MMVTFPHLGPLALALSQLFSYLRIPYLVPGKHGEAAMKTGREMTPEEMCVPFKIMAGNLRSAYEDGADTAVMVATCGPCRLGEYGQLLMEVLRKDGCDYRWVLLDSPAEIGMAEFIRRCRILTEESDSTNAAVIKGVLMCMKMVRRMDALRRKISKMAGCLADPREAVWLLQKTNEELRDCGSFEECFSILKRADKSLSNMQIDRQADPVKLLIVGEIYTSIEEEGNRKLEEKLMRLGCCVERHIDLSWWVRHSVKQALVPQVQRASHKAKDRIPCNIGGYGKETADKIMRSRTYDGIVKIMPSGCMPEIVTKAFCEDVQERYELLILHLIYDEMTGDAGYDTRIEAFVDMLERRKHVLAGD